MTESALVTAVRQGSKNDDDPVRAAVTAAQVEDLVAEAEAITTATDASRARFTEIVREVDVLIGPWRTNFPARNLVQFHEAIRRLLHQRAATVFGRAEGGLIAPKPTESLDPAGAAAILPSQQRGKDLRWLSRLRI